MGSLIVSLVWVALMSASGDRVLALRKRTQSFNPKSPLYGAFAVKRAKCSSIHLLSPPLGTPFILGMIAGLLDRESACRAIMGMRKNAPANLQATDDLR